MNPLSSPYLSCASREVFFAAPVDGRGMEPGETPKQFVDGGTVPEHRAGEKDFQGGETSSAGFRDGKTNPGFGRVKEGRKRA